MGRRKSEERLLKDYEAFVKRCKSLGKEYGFKSDDDIYTYEEYKHFILTGTNPPERIK